MVLRTTQKQNLTRTIAEKELLRSISALEESYSTESDAVAKDALHSQLSELKSILSHTSKKTYAGPWLENAKPKKEPDFAKGPNGTSTQGGTTEPRYEDIALNLRLHKLIFARYGNLISEREEKTVGEIKALVTKSDLTIQSVAETFHAENYKFESHYREAAQKAYNYVRDEIMHIDSDLDVSFWLTPREIVSEKMGDDEDQAVLLCSLLYTLGDELAGCIIAELENSATHAFVMTEINGRHFLLDPIQKKSFEQYCGEKKEILDKYSFNGSRIKRFLYRFNHEHYEQFMQQ